MRALSTALVLSVMAALSAGPALAANTQQTKMTNCNAQATAKNLSADARKSFMSSCLSSGTSAQSAATNKSQACASQADAKKLSGAARTSFVKKCSAG